MTMTDGKKRLGAMTHARWPSSLHGPPPRAKPYLAKAVGRARCGVLPSDCCQCLITVGNVFTIYECCRCGDAEGL